MNSSQNIGRVFRLISSHLDLSDLLLRFHATYITSIYSVLTHSQSRNAKYFSRKLCPALPSRLSSERRERNTYHGSMHRSSPMLVLPERKGCYYLDETVFPPQSGILTPGFSFLARSINPHLSSHSFPISGSLNLFFHGSSKASNLSTC